MAAAVVAKETGTSGFEECSGMDASALLSRLSAEKASVLQQLQKCLQSATNVLIADQVLSEEAVAQVIIILKELDDPEIASEALYDTVMEKAKTDPNIILAFLHSVGKVNPSISNLLHSASRLTWQRLKQKREEVVKTLDASAVIDACAENGIITNQQYKALLKVKQMGKPPDVVADKLLSLLEKSRENEEVSQLAEFEKILVDKQPNVLEILLKSDHISKESAISAPNSRQEAASPFDNDQTISLEESWEVDLSNAGKRDQLGRLRAAPDTVSWLRDPQQFPGAESYAGCVVRGSLPAVSVRPYQGNNWPHRPPLAMPSAGMTYSSLKDSRAVAIASSRKQVGTSATMPIVTSSAASSFQLSSGDGPCTFENSQRLELSENTYDSDFVSIKRQLYEMMIGDGRLNSKRDDSFFTVELENLSPNKVIDLYRKCEGKGFAAQLKSYLVDLLKRRESFQSVVDIFVSALNEEKKQLKAGETAILPRLLLDITPKDVFIALLEVMPDAVHSRLVSLYSSLYCAVPIAYILQLPTGDSKTVTNFKSLQDVLAVPSYPLVVSCGTPSAVRKGKSTLMGKLVGQLETTSLSFDSFDVCPAEGDGGLAHSPCIDFVLEVKANVPCGLNFADVHGFTDDEAFRHAVSTLCSVAALIVIHVTANDFGPGGSLGDNLQSFLRNSSIAHCSNAQIVIFVRDVPMSGGMGDTLPSLSSSFSQSLEEILPNRIAEIVPVEDLAKCRNKRQRQMTVIRIRDQMIPIFRRLKQRMPCSEVIHQRFASSHPAQTQAFVSYGRQSDRQLDGFSSLGKETFEALEASNPKEGELANRLFPLTTIYAAMAKNRHREKKLQEIGVKGKGEEVHSELANLAEEMRKLETQRQTISSISGPVQLFISLVSNEKYHQLSEFQHYLELWKAEYINHLFKERRNLMDQLESTRHADQPTSEQERQDRIHDTKQKLKQLSFRIDQFDISIDSFWSELMELCALIEDDTVTNDQLRKDYFEPKTIKQVYARCVLKGYPMQLLRGNPLQMTANQFMQDIMTQLGVDLKNRSNLVVVSVIGAQSSAKSTLLNYLFGCGFATRAGRCTKGLYASFVRISDGRHLLVLDSEGLLSLEGGGHVFDGQITVMAMACSDAVIVNHKGEISSQMKELLAVCLHAMDYLKVADIRPEMMFVLRDQRDRNTKVQTDSLTLMRSMLREAVGSGQTNLDELVSVRQDAIFLLPSAFSEGKREGRTVESPSAVFSDETFFLRSKILQWTSGDRSIQQSTDDSNPLISWYRHACIVWDTLTKYGYTLLHYKALHELRLHKEVNEIVTSLVKQAERKFNEQATVLVKKHTERLQTVKDEIAIAKYDSECQRELAFLKEETQKELFCDFEKRTQDKKYNEDLKKEFRCKLTTPVSSAHGYHIYSWLRQLQLATDRLNTEAFDRNFYKQLDEALKRTEYQSSMSEFEAATVFDELWSQYEVKYREHVEETKKKYPDIEREILATFREVLTRHKHNNENLFVVSSSCNVASLSKSLKFVNSTDRVWFNTYVGIKSSVLRKAWDFAKKVWVSSSIPTDKATINQDDLTRVVVPEMKKVVESLQNRLVQAIESQDGKCDTDLVTDIVFLTCDQTKQIEDYLQRVNCSLKLRRPLFVNDLIVDLQQVAYQVVCSAEDRRISEQLKELERKKERKRKNFLATVSTEADDLARAAVFAEEYSQQLDYWVESKVHVFTSDVRNQVLQEIPNPEKAAQRAYNSSFKRGNYKEVLEYCIDVNAYLKKLFIQMFEKHKQTAIEANEYRLKDSVTEMYKTLENAADLWQQGSQTSCHLHDFKDHLTKRAENLSEPVSVRTLLMAALVQFPSCSNFPITRVQVFCKRFNREMRDILTGVIGAKLNETVSSSMEAVCSQVWTAIKGCRAKCPLCGSKCSLVNEHDNHECAHHILPAFHGTRVREWNHPVFSMCRSTEAENGRWVRGDDPPKASLTEYLDYYDDCRSWKKSIVPPDPTLLHAPEEQIQAWVNCKQPLLKYWCLKDQTPDDWKAYGSCKSLEEDECDKAKSRLEKFQDV